MSSGSNSGFWNWLKGFVGRQIGAVIVGVAATAGAVMLVLTSQNTQLESLTVAQSTMDARINSNHEQLLEELRAIRTEVSRSNETAAVTENRTATIETQLATIDNRIETLRSDLSSAVIELSSSIARIDPTATEGLDVWNKTYLAKLSQSSPSSLPASPPEISPLTSILLSRFFDPLWQHQLARVSSSGLSATRINPSEARHLGSNVVVLYPPASNQSRREDWFVASGLLTAYDPENELAEIFISDGMQFVIDTNDGVFFAADDPDFDARLLQCPWCSFVDTAEETHIGER